jgi:CheY-like chemotaxis protein
MILQQRGHQVVTAADGQRAVQQAVGLHPDVVVLDLGMPRMDGFEAAQRLRALPGGAQMILIASTGRGQQKDLTRTRAAGFDHHLVKPVDPNSLENLSSRASE